MNNTHTRLSTVDGTSIRNSTTLSLGQGTKLNVADANSRDMNKHFYIVVLWTPNKILTAENNTISLPPFVTIYLRFSAVHFNK